ncbi:MAG: purine permease [Albidovulum sp.]|uniref:nucleobase:cation symporter-2 family protein n=1 Tax=Albidovulum sp. TaxID=1872424 RepID=UPI00132BF603|nr:nucleobase:cation symporter-2 family protein [Defluviimonas sp.]KAB2886304.1 MAG: purine permease [Defluviimonas sp.]
MASTDAIHPVDEVLPAPKLFTLGLQHVLVMYAGAVAVPLIVGRALKLEPADVAFLISADLFVCGIVTLIQSFGATQWFGIRLPVMMGVTFAAVGPMIGFANAQGGPEGARAIFGAIIAAGIISILIAPLVSKMLRFFPPVVTGTIILVIGVSLMRIGINWIFGNPVGPTAPQVIDPAHADWLKAVTEGAASGAITGVPEIPPGLALAAKVNNPLYAPLGNIAISAIVLTAILLIAKFGRGFVANIAVLLGDITGKKVDQPMLSAGLRTDGLGTLIGGIFNTFPYTSFSQNVGLVGVTGIKSRFVCVAGGLIMIVLGLMPKMGALVESVPTMVLGGAGLVMFGMVAATGIRILAGVDFARNRNNLFIVAVSVGFGMIPLVAPNFKMWMPHGIHPLIESGILLASIAAVLLNAFFNGARDATDEIKAAASLADH